MKIGWIGPLTGDGATIGESAKDQSIFGCRRNQHSWSKRKTDPDDL